MSAPLPDDLKLYAAPTWWRCHRDKVWAAAFFALFAYAAVLPSGQSSEPPAVKEKPRVVVTDSLDCLRLQDGLWLRVMVKHTNHAGFSWHECYYGKLERRDIL